MQSIVSYRKVLFEKVLTYFGFYWQTETRNRKQFPKKNQSAQKLQWRIQDFSEGAPTLKVWTKPGIRQWIVS